MTSRGTYLLILRLTAARRVRIGKLGRFALRPGLYAYAGSARGPGGLAARMRHHARVTHHPHWHIDYLRVVAKPVQVWTTPDCCEHEWAAALCQHPSFTTPVKGFGSSDCSCHTHLFLHESSSLDTLALELQDTIAGAREMDLG
jgi:Uri superfamily endonuclease